MEESILSGGRRLKDALTLSSIFYSGYRSLKKGENCFEGGHFLTVIFAESGSFTLKYQGISLTVTESFITVIPPQTPYTLTCENLKARIFACEFAQKSDIDLKSLCGSCALVVGSEGGFSQEEFELAQKLGYNGVTLGKRILRAETAAITLTSIVMFSLGEMQ